MHDKKHSVAPSGTMRTADSAPPTSASIASSAERLRAKIGATPILDALQSPSELKQLSGEQLVTLCDELRRDLIGRVNEVGGHFASSLGVTELTVALHAVFDTPHDRIVWDVGHQAYIHKILTGRREELSGVRQYGGISGFPRRCESEFDTFGVAHAGTSVSAAIGMLEASFHEYPGREDRQVVAVIGDGAMTAGMAFEALNHSGQLHRKLIVVLNDNEMSIAPNVGALSWAFSKTVTSSFSTVARRHFKSLVQKGLIPKAFYRALDRAEEATQGFFSTPAMLFESFGYRYLGPVDGHDIHQVIDALERAKRQDGPVLVHALTTKGKGFEPAENDPVKYHAVNAHSLFGLNGERAITEPDQNGKVRAPVEVSLPAKARAPSYTDVFGTTMVELCSKDARLVGITAAMPDGTGLTHLAREMPDRFFDVGIAEQHAVTFAAGLACEGMKPVCAIYSTFLQRGYDQVVHDVCIQSLPVVFAIDRGGLVGADGPTHHGVFDFAYLRILPNMVVMAPKDEGELRDMLYTASRYEKGPTSLRYPRGNGVGADLSAPPTELEIGKAEVIRGGKNARTSVLLVGIGATVRSCVAAANELAIHGIESTVVNARFVKPLDEVLFTELIPQHELLVTVEDHSIVGGFGSAVAEFLVDAGLSHHVQMARLGIGDSFVEHGTQEELYRECGFDVTGIVSCVLSRVAQDQGDISSASRFAATV